jgi:hypothetical protein
MIWWHRKVIFLYLKRGSDETSCLKSSSGDEWFRLVQSRNWSKFLNWLWLEKVISEILKPLKMVLCSSCGITYIIKIKIKTCQASCILQRIDWVYCILAPSSNGWTMPLMQIPILLLIKVMQTNDHWSTDPTFWAAEALEFWLLLFLNFVCVGRVPDPTFLTLTTILTSIRIRLELFTLMPDPLTLCKTAILPPEYSF